MSLQPPNPAAVVYKIGDRVFFWTGRGSYGNATIVGTRKDHFLLEPDADAHKGGDYWKFESGNEKWAVHSFGVLASQLNTEPKIWWTNY